MRKTFFIFLFFVVILCSFCSAYSFKYNWLQRQGFSTPDQRVSVSGIADVYSTSATLESGGQFVPLCSDNFYSAQQYALCPNIDSTGTVRTVTYLPSTGTIGFIANNLSGVNWFGTPIRTNFEGIQASAIYDVDNDGFDEWIIITYHATALSKYPGASSASYNYVAVLSPNASTNFNSWKVEKWARINSYYKINASIACGSGSCFVSYMAGATMYVKQIDTNHSNEDILQYGASSYNEDGSAMSYQPNYMTAGDFDNDGTVEVIWIDKYHNTKAFRLREVTATSASTIISNISYFGKDRKSVV